MRLQLDTILIIWINFLKTSQSNYQVINCIYALGHLKKTQFVIILRIIRLGNVPVNINLKQSFIAFHHLLYKNEKTVQPTCTDVRFNGQVNESIIVYANTLLHK